MSLPTLSLETQRLLIRGFVPDDLPGIHRILDQAFGDGRLVQDPAALAERSQWLQWQALSHEWFPRMHQPPYGDRAVVLRASGELVGAVGYVPCLDVFEQIPALRVAGSPGGWATPEVGLFWVVDPAHQRQGYATEAGRALVEHAFQQMRLKRIIATTEYGNLASQAVMRRLGMRLHRNPLPDPPWLQVVGVLEHPA